jgi:hypothetical protein
MAPNQVTKENKRKLWESLYLYSDPFPLNFKYKVGDKVRISNWKKTFKKGYLKHWTDEIFIITHRLSRSPPVYRIKDHKD